MSPAVSIRGNVSAGDGALPAASRAPRRLFLLVVKVAVSVLVLFALVWRFRDDIPSLSTVDPWSMAEAVALLLLQPALIGVRWWLIIQPYGSRSSLASLTSVSWVAVFANQFLPAGIGGDAIRIFYARRLGNGLGSAAASVLMDRVMAMVALVGLIVLLTPALPAAVDRRIIVALALLSVGGIAALVAIFLFVRSGRLARISSPKVQKVLDLVHYVLRTCSRPFHTGLAILLSVAIHLLSFAAFLAIVEGLSIRVDFEPFLAVSALLTLVQILPISIGGWGVREFAAVSLLGFIGVPAGPALLASLILGFCYSAASLPGAFAWPFLRARAPERSGAADL